MAPTRMLRWVCPLAIVLTVFAHQAQAESETVRQPLDPARANTIRFAAAEARFVRLVILRSHGAPPCIDELEAYGPGSRDNLALATRGAKASASSCFLGNAFHQVKHLNDGQYGNSHSWIAATGEGWAQIEFPATTVVERVVLSRDRDGRYEDRLPARFDVQVSLDGSQWRTVASIESAAAKLADSILVWPRRPTQLDFPPQTARFVRMTISRTSGGPPCIDELEVYGSAPQRNLALAATGARASASSTLEGYAAHRVEHLNDGQYGNPRSWIPQAMPAWAQIELGAETQVQRVVFSRDRLGAYQDRVPTTFEILVSRDGRAWQAVKKITALPEPPLETPSADETPQEWSWRIVSQLSGSLRKAGEQRRAKVRSLADARDLLDLVRLEQQRRTLARRLTLECNPEAIRRAVNDLAATFPGRYRVPERFDQRLDEATSRVPQLRQMLDQGDPAQVAQAADDCQQLLAFPRSVLLANPLLDFQEILVLKRKTPAEQRAIYWTWGQKYGMPVNWSCDFRPKNPPIAPWWEDELAALSLRGAKPGLRTVYKPPATHMLLHPELHFDAQRLLFAMPGANQAFQVFETRLDGTGLRQVTHDTGPDVDNGDPCYLPDGRIVFNSTRMFAGVPCEDGESYISGLCLMDADGRHTRMLTFDQESNWYPSLLNDGRVLYTRYEYANVSHQFGRHLFHMNPDGSSQMEYYGSNSYWPNSIFYARAVPNHPTLVVGVVCGHHGPNRTGRLVLFDPARGRRETAGAVQTIPGYGKPVQRVVEDMLYSGDWPKFAHPWPLSDKYFLVAARPGPEQTEYGIYLVDVFDNMTEICRLSDASLFEPIPIKARPKPPTIPDRVDPQSRTATVYLADVYHGAGLRGMPRGAVKQLRLFTYNYVYRHVSRRGFGHLATPGVDGPWEPRFLLGTVPVENDGSALFQVPANTPISVQPVDAQGRALQQMRSWFTAMPGERLSCVGCHESQNATPPPMTAAVQGRPHRIEPWRGPARGFDFAREVQPVLDRFCVGCHDGTHQDRPDLARKSEAEQRRVSQAYQQATGTAISTVFTPAFLALHPYVRRPHAESNHSPKAAAEYFADTSLLVQMLVKGHHNVRLDDEAWQRLYAWIDLGAPDHGSWHNSVWGSPENYHRRRLEMLRQFADRTDDVEWMPAASSDIPPFNPPPKETAAPAAPACPGWPFDAVEARRRQQAAGLPTALRYEMAKDVPIDFVLVPAGEFVLGDPQGAPDERRTSRVRIEKPFYMSRCEITNAQFAALVDPLHDSGHADWLSIDWRGEGYPLSAPDQPVVRVSNLEAAAFCRALGTKLGRRVELPSEAQWEWACRAGSAGPLWYGDFNADFSKCENLAGREQRELAFPAKPKWFLRDDRFDDRLLVSAPVGTFQPNAWGLCDMSGNVAEWTRAAYRPDPGDAADNSPDAPQTERVVRGGSWRSRPQEATSARRWQYPAWRKVFDVGFRVVLAAERP